MVAERLELGKGPLAGAVGVASDEEVAAEILVARPATHGGRRSGRAGPGGAGGVFCAALPWPARPAPGVAFAVDQCPQHRPARGAEDVASDRVELDAGILEGLLDALALGAVGLDEPLAAAGQIPQLADLRRGTKLPRSSPCSSSSANQAASPTSVLRPGRILTWWALTSSNSYSSLPTSGAAAGSTINSTVTTSWLPGPGRPDGGCRPAGPTEETTLKTRARSKQFVVPGRPPASV